MAPIMAHVTWTVILFMAVTMQFVGAQEENDKICRPPTVARLKNVTTGAFDATKYPPSSFRNGLEAEFFRAWPEDITNPRFRYPCQDDTNLSLANFTATCDQTTGRLDPRPYYDVGRSDRLRPYYKHWGYHEVLSLPAVQLYCERKDMRKLYSHRLWDKAILPALVTTIVLLIILESTAVLTAFLYCRKLADLGFDDTVADCLHLLMLIIAGFTMIEGVSHSSSTSWRSACMHDAAVIYTYLTLFATVSSFLRQVASACIPDSSTPTEQKKPRSDDWRWQRVFNQFAVVMLMTAFLLYNENKAGTALDALVSVIWSVIVLAGTWSMGVSLVIAASAVTRLGNERSEVVSSAHELEMSSAVTRLGNERSEVVSSAHDLEMSSSVNLGGE